MDNETPFHQPEAQVMPPPSKNEVAENIALRTVMTIISSATLGLALLSGAVIAFALLAEKFISLSNPVDRDTIVYKAVPIGITYFIGWVIALISIRKLNNIILPILINVYAWLTIIGISILYIAMIFKLYGQVYVNTRFPRYMLIMVVLFIAFIGLHLLLKEHSLLFFSMPLLAINLIHLFTIVYYYVYSTQAINESLWRDLFFFFEMSAVSILMLLHLGLLSIPRSFISHLFNDSQTSNSSS